MRNLKKGLSASEETGQRGPGIITDFIDVTRVDGGSKAQRTADTFPSVGYRMGSSPSLGSQPLDTLLRSSSLSSSDVDGLGYSWQGLKLILTHLILNKFYLGTMSLLIRF
jgi:hypothetical protein